MSQDESHDEAEAAEGSDPRAGSVGKGKAGGFLPSLWKERGSFLAVLAIVISFFSVQAASRSATAAKEMVEEHTSPKLYARATFVEMPVPDISVLYPHKTHVDSLVDRVIGPIYGPFLRSRGAWEVSVENDGDAVAHHVRIRAPGIFFARHVSYATGAEINSDAVKNSEFDVGDLAPQQRFSGVFWVRPGFTLTENCGMPVLSAGCFTLEQIKVFGDNTTATVRRSQVRPPGFGEFVTDSRPR